MVIKNKLILAFSAIIALATTLTIVSIFNPYSIKTYNLDKLGQDKSNIVVLICMLEGSGGTERCTLMHQQELLKKNYLGIIITKHNGFLSHYCKNNGLPLITCSSIRISFDKFVWMPGLNSALKALTTNCPKNIKVFHCSQRREVFVAKNIAVHHSIPVALTRHNIEDLPASVRHSVDGVIGVCPQITEKIISLNKIDKIQNKIIKTIPPFFDYSCFLNFKAEYSKEFFFKKTFGIKLKPYPLIVKVAHLYGDVLHKNHPLLFQAMHDLIYQRNTPVQVVLAGNGKNLAKYKKMVHDLKLEEYVYFLGGLASSEQAAAVFHYADINLLASSKEAFGIVLLEGGILKKPTICARGGCGAADWLIIDGETGFLFENKNATDLANKISFVLSHKDLAQACGKKLHKKIIDGFLPRQTTSAMLEFYSQLHVKKHSPHGEPE